MVIGFYLGIGTQSTFKLWLSREELEAGSCTLKMEKETSPMSQWKLKIYWWIILSHLIETQTSLVLIIFLMNYSLSMFLNYPINSAMILIGQQQVMRLKTLSSSWALIKPLVPMASLPSSIRNIGLLSKQILSKLSKPFFIQFLSSNLLTILTSHLSLKILSLMMLHILGPLVYVMWHTKSFPRSLLVD